MQVSVHPFVIGEVACGYLADHVEVLESLQALPTLPVIDHADVGSSKSRAPANTGGPGARHWSG
jgi:hypothetical protein